MHNLNIDAIAELLKDKRIWAAGKEGFNRAGFLRIPLIISLVHDAVIEVVDVGDSDEIDFDATWYASAVIAEYYRQDEQQKKFLNK